MELHSTTLMGAHVQTVNELPLRCEKCAARVTLDLRHFTVSAGEGAGISVTYADTDIVVWDCPVCTGANADVLNEG